MPVEFTRYNEGAPDAVGAPFYDGTGALRLRLKLRPHKSLTPRGFVWFISITAALLAVPLLPLLNSPVFWGILPFILLAIFAIWAGLKRSWSDAELCEELWLWSEHIYLTRQAPGKPPQIWEANPYWTTLSIRAEGGPVANYVTLKGDGREVELGAFLSPEERRELYDDLGRELAAIK